VGGSRSCLWFRASRWLVGLQLVSLSVTAQGAPGNSESPSEKKASAEVSEPDAKQTEPSERELPSPPRYWQSGKIRPFVSGQVLVGFPTGASLFAGYGRPRWIWAGAEATVFTTTGFTAIAAGLRAEALLINGLIRARRTWAYRRRLVPEMESYETDDFLSGGAERAHYSSVDAWLWGVIPAGPTLGIWAARGVHHLDVPSGSALFSEMVRTPLSSSRALLLQGLWFLKLANDKLMLGPAVDAVLTPDRRNLLRVGGGGAYAFGAHLDLRVVVTLPVNSQDRLGLVSTAYGAVALRWTGATGEASPGFL